MYTSIIILSVWLHRDRHRALRPRIHQPFLLDSEERHVPPTCSTTQGDKWQRLCQNSLVLHVRLPGHAKDRPGEFYPSLSFSDPDKLQQTPGMSGISCKSHFLYFIQTFIIVTQKKLFLLLSCPTFVFCSIQLSSVWRFFFFFQRGILDNEMSFLYIHTAQVLARSRPRQVNQEWNRSEQRLFHGLQNVFVCWQHLRLNNL